MVQKFAIDSLKNKNVTARTLLEQENQDNEARDRMAGESPAYQHTIENQDVPRLKSHLKKVGKSRLSVFPLLIGLIAAGTLIYLNSRKSLI